MFYIFIILSCPAKCKRFLKKIATFETNLLYLEQGVLLLHLERIMTLPNARLIAKTLKCHIDDLYGWND